MKNPWIIGLVAIVVILLVWHYVSGKKETTKETPVGSGSGSEAAKRMAMVEPQYGGYKTGGNIMCECANGKICFSGNGGSGCSCCKSMIEAVPEIRITTPNSELIDRRSATLATFVKTTSVGL